MDSSTRYGKLYSYFLEVAKEVLYKILHDDMKVPRTGNEMYNYFKVQNFQKKVWECNHLSIKQKEFLFPHDGKIDLNNLDFTMYYQIYVFLDGVKRKSLVKYLKNLRNELCHLSLASLRSDFRQAEFEKHWDKITNHLRYYFVDSELLEKCLKNIRDRK